jgi:phage terminase large subunit-like protein
MSLDLARDYVSIANQYAADVLSGAIPACRWVRLAAQRQLDDLRREQPEDFPWHFDADLAARPCRFIELLPHIKGKWETPYLRLEPWQIFIICTVFGWVDTENNRRFRTVYIEVPRKNGKSALSSGIALYAMCENEPGAEVYSAATKKDQARIVFDISRRMAMRSPGLKRRFGLEVEKGRIFIEESAREFKPLSSDEDGLDGLNIHCVIIDELHAHKTRAVWDVLDTATGAREQPLIWAITTAGSNRAGVCYEQRGYVLDILQRRKVDDSYFGIIYTIDLEERGPDGEKIPGDDPWAESSWIKANPNWGVSVKVKDFRSIAKKAKASSASQNGFLTKRSNIWVNANAAWLSMPAWDRCADPSLKLEQFERERCFMGLDLASKKDIAAKVYLFRREGHLYCFTQCYLPGDAIEDGWSQNSGAYSGWAQDGYIALTEGSAIDHDLIERDIRDDAGRFELACISHDNAFAQQLSGHLLDEGLPVVECRTNAPNLSEPMKTVEALVLAGKFHHDGNPVMTWMMSNVVAHPNAKDELFPNKEHFDNKIDGPVALFCAVRETLLERDPYADLTCTVIG